MNNRDAHSGSGGPKTTLRGAALLGDPHLNKDTAFSEEERERFGLRGLLPPHVETLEDQLARAIGHYQAKRTDLGRYIYLGALHDRNETLFHALLERHLEKMMPIVYTPTVGEACSLYGNLFRRTRGLYVSSADRGRVAELVGNWAPDNVRVIVVTDGERILGLGDLGTNGMGIPVGKLLLYTACAGIAPTATLPVTIDVGTENQALREDPLYMGLRQPRVRGEAYDELIEEFVQAARQRWPGVLIQFEDFANRNAFRLLEHYRDRICMFNDDIQGTAAVTLAGLFSAIRITGGRLADQRLLFLGAGGAGLGIGELIVSALRDEGLSDDDARRRCWFVDSRGLVVAGRDDLSPQKRRFAHDHEPAVDLLGAVETLRPTGIIGVSAQPGSFTREVVEAMGRLNDRPIVFPLSNPTSKAECTAEQAYRWTAGRAVFASGSPFDPVELDGRTLVPGQGNNAYIFPGVGLGVVASRARRVTDEMFAAAARTLASLVGEDDLERGRVYPALSRIRETSVAIAVEVARVAYEQGLVQGNRPDDLAAVVRREIFEPSYRELH